MRALLNIAKDSATMMMLYVKFTSSTRGWRNLQAERKKGERKCDERGKMFQQLSLINQKVNFFLYILDYEFNPATIRRD